MRRGDIDTVVQLLTAGAPGTSVEAKYFLIQVVYRFGDAPVELTVEQLHSMFGMSVGVVIRARDELLENGYLVDRPFPGQPVGTHGLGVRGRPRRGFRLSKAYRREIEQGSSEALSRPRWSYMVQAALSLGHQGVERPRRVRMGNSRGIAPRMLLAALWSLADSRATVSEASHTKLAHMLGIGVSVGRIRAQLKRLHELGYINANIPGITGRRVPGRVSGTVVLNPTHGDYSTSGVPPRRSHAVQFNDFGIDGLTWTYSMVDRIERQAHLHPSGETPKAMIELRHSEDVVLGRLSNEDRPAKLEGGEPFDLYRAFSGEPQRRRVRSYITFKMYDYAAWLVDNYPEQVVSQEPKVVPHLIERVQNELCSNRRLKEEFGEPFPYALAAWFYVHIWDIARGVITATARTLELEKKDLARWIGGLYSGFIIIPKGLANQVNITFEDSTCAHSRSVL